MQPHFTQCRSFASLHLFFPVWCRPIYLLLMPPFRIAQANTLKCLTYLISALYLKASPLAGGWDNKNHNNNKQNNNNNNNDHSVIHISMLSTSPILPIYIVLLSNFNIAFSYWISITWRSIIWKIIQVI